MQCHLAVKLRSIKTRNFVGLFRFRPSPLKDTATSVSLALEEWMASQSPLTSHRDDTTAKGEGMAVYAWQGSELVNSAREHQALLLLVIWTNYSYLGLGFVWGIGRVKVLGYAIVGLAWKPILRHVALFACWTCGVHIWITNRYGTHRVVSPVSSRTLTGRRSIVGLCSFDLPGFLAASQSVRRSTQFLLDGHQLQLSSTTSCRRVSNYYHPATTRAAPLLNTTTTPRRPTLLPPRAGLLVAVFRSLWVMLWLWLSLMPHLFCEMDTDALFN